MDASVHSETDFSSTTLSPDDPEFASGTFSSDSARKQTGAESASGSGTEGPSYGGTIFSQAHHFSVSGGTFTNVTHNHNTVSTALSNFRQIPLGDIDLRELRLERGSGCFVRERQSTCRVYAARVEGRNTGVTVAIYEGDGAKEVCKKWREDIYHYSSLRHPNFVQLWGVTTSSRIHAAIFHDDLIPFRHFRDLHGPVLVVYIHAYVTVEYWKSEEYFNSAFDGSGLYHHECSLWIHLSTGRLCLDPAPGISERFGTKAGIDMKSNPPALTALKAPETESMAVNSLKLDQYHWICRCNLARNHSISVPASETVHLASLIYWPSGSQFQQSVQPASIAELDISVGNWWSSDMVGNVMQNGWTRYHFAGVLTDLLVPFWLYRGQYNIWETWLSQANHLFSRLQITTHLEGYGLVDGVDYSIELHETGTKNLPIGYLFFCPSADFQIGPSSFRWPECPAYWSLDPSGIECLSTEEATRLGFPSIQLKTRISLCSWDASVYAGLRQFHQAKGFDPDSQDVARHLGEPLLELTKETDHFGQVTDELSGFWADDEDWNLGFADPDLEPGYNVEPYPEEDSALTEIDEFPVQEITTEAEELHEERQTVSATLNFIISVQLALIFLACLTTALFNAPG
ncbi:hypothetical protein C8R47DRAFT_4240 [Mycena vitilis]|nr:hypothetical protein C8R47DRAFT_4240 [Mycena vitilis]